MIKSITINKGSYKEETKLETDKRINLLFGFNGTGKTLLSREFMKNGNNIEWDIKDNIYNIDILVFNTFYIHDTFLIENKSIKPIFYLGQNKQLKNLIQQKEEEKHKLEYKNKQLKGELEENNIIDNLKELNKNKFNTYEEMYNIVWNIYKNNKDQHKQCLFEDFKKNKKEDFFTDYEKQDIIEITTTEEKIYEKLYELDKNNIKEIPLLQTIDITNINKIINDEIFKTKIIGNENSNIAKYIDELNNQKWVKEGYDLCLTHNLTKCPFCQQETINKNFLDELKKYFNEAYTRDIEYINKLNSDFKQYKYNININQFISNEKIYTNDNHTEKLTILLTNIETKLQDIEKQIIYKLHSPSEIIILSSIDNEITEFNNFIEEINKEIIKSNEEFKNKKNTQKELVKQFWSIKKLELNDEILNKKAEINAINDKINKINDEVFKNQEYILELDKIISTNKPKLNDIGKAVNNINQQLTNMGITDFTIKPIKNDNNLITNNSLLEEYQYTLDRNNTNAEFQSFSEGEKMIISFLYFIEVCKSNTEKGKKIIAVIDDPISSLSSNNLFAVADIIKKLMTQGNYIQFFIMTHNIYFFDEIYRFIKNKYIKEKNNVNENKLKNIEKLQDINDIKKAIISNPLLYSHKTFHIKKYNGNSTIEKLNEKLVTYKYISFWDAYKEIRKNDDIYNPTLSNIMRNILEFFCIIFYNTGYKSILKDDKYKTLLRFIDKESHNQIEKDLDIVNMSDVIKLFEDFFNTDFKEHFNAMMKI